MDSFMQETVTKIDGFLTSLDYKGEHEGYTIPVGKCFLKKAYTSISGCSAVLNFGIHFEESLLWRWYPESDENTDAQWYYEGPWQQDIPVLLTDWLLSLEDESNRKIADEAERYRATKEEEKRKHEEKTAQLVAAYTS